MNRHARRSDMRTFRRSELLTHMVAADDVALLEGHRTLKTAVQNWQAGRVLRKLLCIGCKASFADEAVKPAFFLFAVPIGVDGLVSTSAFCACCWQTLSTAEVDAVSTRGLRRLAPGGCFLDTRRR
jgi:hypothetical protein